MLEIKNNEKNDSCHLVPPPPVNPDSCIINTLHISKNKGSERLRGLLEATQPISSGANISNSGISEFSRTLPSFHCANWLSQRLADFWSPPEACAPNISVWGPNSIRRCKKSPSQLQGWLPLKTKFPAE